METKWITKNELHLAVERLQAGEVVAFPTETVYGLGADAKNDEAVKKIFIAKNRPSDNPLIVHISKIEQLDGIVEDIPNKAEKLMDAFWPGPLTIIFKAKNEVFSSVVTAGLSTVGVRMPQHPLALELIDLMNTPLAAPSANSSGKPSPTLPIHVKHDLDGKISGIIDGGETGVGLESTIIDLTDETKPMVYRPGGISVEQIEQVIGKVTLADSLVKENEQPKSPGLKYKHYAPNQPVWIVHSEWKEAIEQLSQKGEKIALLASEEVVQSFKGDVTETFSLGKKVDPKLASRLLYQGLRDLDEKNVSIILAEAYPTHEIGTAYMNRLKKAAGNHFFD